jgi:hypothetical protein
MNVISTTDGKYIGAEVPDNIVVGDFVVLGDDKIEVHFLRRLENGRVCFGNSNFLIIAEV